MLSSLHTDVLIVGAGPVGLATALLLEQLGVACIVVERREGLHTAPQAHVISSRSLEICRGLGIDLAAIRAGGTNPADTLSIRWVDRLLGQDLGVYSFLSDVQGISRMIAQTPTPICNLSQDRFEALLADRLSPATPVLFGHSWSGCEASGDGYLSCVLKGSGNEPIEIYSRFIIGADGAGSSVRAAIGSAMVGPHHLQNFVNVHFSADLREQLKGREGLLYWVMDADYFGTFIAHDIGGNWIYMKTVDSDITSSEIDQDEYVKLLKGAIGANVDLAVHSISSWVMTAQVASVYQNDGIFLVGDAAHRFPPTGGIGMNTGIGDAHNLAWKIGMVLKGFDERLLQTYQPERRPVAESNSTQSLLNARKMSEVTKALDVNGDGLTTMSDLEATMTDPARRSAVQNAIDHQADHFNMSGLDLGFCYASSAVLDDGSPPQSDHPVSKYVPSTTPGARLPHAWLERNGQKISTLDLVRCDRFLVLAVNGGNPELEQSVASLVGCGYPLEYLPIGHDSEIRPLDSDYAIVFPASVALLIRPDGHVGARFGLESAARRLPEILTRVLAAK